MLLRQAQDERKGREHQPPRPRLLRQLRTNGAGTREAPISIFPPNRGRGAPSPIRAIDETGSGRTLGSAPTRANGAGSHPHPSGHRRDGGRADTWVRPYQGERRGEAHSPIRPIDETGSGRTLGSAPTRANGGGRHTHPFGPSTRWGAGGHLGPPLPRRTEEGVTLSHSGHRRDGERADTWVRPTRANGGGRHPHPFGPSTRRGAGGHLGPPLPGGTEGEAPSPIGPSTKRGAGGHLGPPLPGRTVGGTLSHSGHRRDGERADTWVRPYQGERRGRHPHPSGHRRNGERADTWVRPYQGERWEAPSPIRAIDETGSRADTWVRPYQGEWGGRHPHLNPLPSRERR